MKKIVLIVFCCLSVWTIQANQNELDIIFEKGNQAYKNANYGQAISLYESISVKGYENASLYYNLGNAYFRSAQYGKSILNYERALRLNPADESTKMNLQIVNSKTIDKIEEIPPFLLKKWWLSFVNFFSLSNWTAISLILLLLFCAVFGYFLLNKSYSGRRNAFYGSIALFAIFVLSIVSTTKAYQIRFAKDAAIITEAFVQAKSSPSETGTDKFVVHEGTKIKVEETLNNWAKIKLYDGTIGWVPENSFEII